jgi:hypothetical protein
MQGDRGNDDLSSEDAVMANGSGGEEIRSELRGGHWIAWVARSADGKPEASVVLVGQTQAEAVERAKQWAERKTK